jgi:hypothetical protein
MYEPEKLPVACTGCGRDMVPGSGRGRNVFCLDCRRTVVVESPEVLSRLDGEWVNDRGISRWRTYAGNEGGLGGVTGAIRSA